MLCVDAGHTQCAQVICDILNRKGRKGSYDAGVGYRNLGLYLWLKAMTPRIDVHSFSQHTV